MNRGRTKIRIKTWTLGTVCLLMLTAGAVVARGAVEQKRNGAPPWLGLFGVAIRPDGSIFIVGSKALLMTSTDQGKTWVQHIVKERPGSDLFQDRDLYSIRFTPDGKSGWIVGEEGTIMHSDDGGQTWSKQDAGTQKSLLKVCVIDAQNVVAVGADGTIVRSTDGGQHWTVLKSPKLITLFDVTFTDKNTGWIAGEFSTILKSTDGGQTWNIAYGGNTGDFTIGPFFTITFTAAQHGIAAGLSGELAVTSDGGKTWQNEKLPDSISSYVMSLDPATKKVWAGGSGGKMFDQGAGGQWQEAARATFHDVTDIAFVGNQGVAVGLNGTILLTQNAGEQWQAVQ
jgi:photosystem II stability/assembly factor-like uncharacterized protein